MDAIAVTAGTVWRLVGVTAVVLVVQFTLGLEVAVGGAHPDLMLLVPIAAGVAGGPVEGALAGFVAGMAADLLLPTPFGLSALVGTLLGYAVGYAAGTNTKDHWWLSALAALVASVGAVMLYAVLGAVLGQDQFLKVDLATVVAVVALVNGALAGPAVRLFGWVLAGQSANSPVGAGRRR